MELLCNFAFPANQIRKIGVLYLMGHVRGQSETVTLLKHYMNSWEEAAFCALGEADHRESTMHVRARCKRPASDKIATRSICWVSSRVVEWTGLHFRRPGLRCSDRKGMMLGGEEETKMIEPLESLDGSYL